MINDYKIKYKNKEEVLYLYLDYSLEIGSMDNIEKKLNLIEKIKEFIKERKIKFNGKYIVLVIGSIAIATLTCNFGKINEAETNFIPNTEIVDMIDYKTFPNLINNDIKSDNFIIEDNIVSKSNEKITTNEQESSDENNMISDSTINTINTDKVNDNTSSNNTIAENTTTNNIINKSEINSTSDNIANNTTTNNTNTNNTTTNNTNTNEAATSNTNETTTNNNTENNSISETNTTNNQNEEENSNATIVTIYRSNGTILSIELEEYLIGVVAAEMPASFNIEALKAQAVVARTYTLKKISQNQVLTDTTSTQVYKDNTELKALWGSSYDTYYNKIKLAVDSTEGQYITYNGNYIDAVYHSTSNGYTVDAKDVWGNDVPYLKSVDSIWDKDASSYLRTTTFDLNEINTLLNVTLNTSIELIRDSNNRVVNVIIGNQSFTGTEFRNLLGLRSTDFDIDINDNIVTITTRGYGHGVGMSQYGANGMAKDGYTYQEILHHYYTNIQIKTA